MTTVKVKICGLKRELDVKLACELGADMLGFVVEVPSSPRSLSLEEAARLMELVPEDVRSVIVTVPQGLRRVLEAYKRLKPDILQIHGHLELSGLREEIPNVKIVKALGMRSSSVIEEALKCSKFVDGFLADSPHPGKFGGTGLTHDWSLSKRLRDAVYPKPFILAGGLNPENVESAVRLVKPYAVDVSSGVELKPGMKDPEKLEAFIIRAKSVRLDENYQIPWWSL